MQHHRFFKFQDVLFPLPHLEPKQLQILCSPHPQAVEREEKKPMQCDFSQVVRLVEDYLVTFVRGLAIDVDFVISAAHCIDATGFYRT